MKLIQSIKLLPKPVSFPNFHLNYRYYSVQPELTSIRYQDQVKRGNFATINDRHVSFFERILTKQRVFTDPLDLEGPNTDWLRSVRGKHP